MTKAASIKVGKRRGYTLLEVQVSFALLGIGLAGLCPLVVMQLRQVRQLELRLQGQVVETNPATGVQITMLPGNTYYIVPWTNVWQKSGRQRPDLDVGDEPVRPRLPDLANVPSASIPRDDHRARLRLPTARARPPMSTSRPPNTDARNRLDDAIRGCWQADRSPAAPARLRRPTPSRKLARRDGFGRLPGDDPRALAGHELRVPSAGQRSKSTPAPGSPRREFWLRSRSPAIWGVSWPIARAGLARRAEYSFTGWDLAQGDALVLNFQGATSSDLIVITYQQSGNQLGRYRFIQRHHNHRRQLCNRLFRRAEPRQYKSGPYPDHNRVPVFLRNLYLGRSESPMIRSRQAKAPRGYSLTVVLVFLILLFALWSTVYRSSSSLLGSKPTASYNKPATRAR